MDLSRVNIVGASGSGKSTFSKQLAVRLRLPRIEMDQLFWNPGWQASDDALFFSRLENALTVPEWILDGNYDRSRPIKWKSVRTVVWIDYSFMRTFYQAVKRALGRALSQQEIWPDTGNRESFARTFFSRESVLIWTITTHGKFRKRYEACMRNPQYSHIHFVRLRSPTEAKSFLAQL